MADFRMVKAEENVPTIRVQTAIESSHAQILCPAADYSSLLAKLEQVVLS